MLQNVLESARPHQQVITTQVNPHPNRESRRGVGSSAPLPTVAFPVIGFYALLVTLRRPWHGPAGRGAQTANESSLGKAPAARRERTGVLLETKLHAPRVRTEWVERRGLVGGLDDARVKLVLVGAPAGYGKTTLLAQWCSEAGPGRPFAWISLDHGDNDPVRLWEHVVSALQRVCPGLAVDEILCLLRRQMPDIDAALVSHN